MCAKIKAGITQGDTNGIGWEVILKSLADPRMCEMVTPVIYGSRTAADFYRETVDEEFRTEYHAVRSAKQAAPKGVNLVDTGGGKEPVEPGKPTKESGEAAVSALRQAVDDLKEGAIDFIVTAPLCKENAQGEEFRYPGHTEYLAAQFGGEPTMMMCSGNLRVALVTSHIPLAEVPGAITREKITEKLRRLRRTLIADFGIVEPRIAVLALNPHAGEGGLLGKEEQETIRPAIEDAFAENIYAFGPFAADGLFLSGEFVKYDALLAMYHDQGLAPFKALAPDGVNVTAGLDIVRTAPDHGTAFDIAGKGIADPSAMRNAIYMGMDVLRSRRNYAEASQNPLKHYEREKGADITLDLTKTEL